MTSASLGVIVGALILTCPSGPSGRQADRLDWAQTAGHTTKCRPDDQRRPVDCELSREPAGSPASEVRSESEFAIADELSACSPFFGIEGDKELDFDVATRAVTETINRSGEPGGEANSPPIEIVGTFAINGQTGRIVTVIAGAKREYTLIVPTDGAQCILALGKPKAVDLGHSWFAAPSDDTEPDPPEYQHA